ncbi:MAG TPA: hypothetical protein VF158_14440 [Longimicrobiales bacterium]
MEKPVADMTVEELLALDAEELAHASTDRLVAVAERLADVLHECVAACNFIERITQDRAAFVQGLDK